MAALNITIGDFNQLSLTFTKGGLTVDLTGAQQIAYTLLYINGSPAAQWTLTGGQIANPNPTTGVALLTVTPAMLAAFTADVTLTGIASLIDSLGNPTLKAGVDTIQFLLPPVPAVVA